MLDAVGVYLGHEFFEIWEFPELRREKVCFKLTFDEVLNCVLPVHYFVNIYQGGNEPALKKPSTETRPAMVDIVEKRSLKGPRASLNNLEMLQGLTIQDHIIVQLLDFRRV